MFPPDQPSAQFPYRVEAKVGEGAMGEVYKATETSLGRPVAIKILKPSFLESLDASRAREATQRFLQEARAAARLSHPGVTTIYRVGVEAHTPYIAMEWLDGEDLERTIRRGHALSVQEVVALGVELAETLAAAHRAGVVHRDVKPGNVIRLRDGHVKVADFGVARVTDSDLVQTQAGAILGTPLYSAPEQLHGHAIDGRADLYSVGAVLYELLTRRTPYVASSLIELIQQVISNRAPEPPHTLNPQVSRELGAVILKALSKDPEDRHADGDALAAALRPFLAPVDAYVAATLAATPLPAQVLAPVTVLPGATPLEIVSNLARHWPGKPLGSQDVDALVERLLERPLHAAPFAGVAHIGDAFFLIHGGLVYGILDPKRGLTGDIVEETLPAQAPATLHPVPSDLDPRVVPLLASTLLPPDYVHDALDVSFVDLAQLTAKLGKDGFDGVVRFAQGPQHAYLFISRGRPVLHLFSRGWTPDPTSQPWTSWIASSGATASVERRRTHLSTHSYRRALRDFSFAVESRELDGRDLMHSAGANTPLAVSLSLTPEREPPATGDATLSRIYTSDPLYSFLDWMGRDLPSFFAERDRVKRWRYLAEWVPLVRRAILHHALPRPNSQDSDTFDLVTFDEDGKALHLAHRHAHGSAAALEAFVERVVAAKTARIKTGDIGGACFIAPSFDDDALALYDTMTVHEEKRSLLFSLQDSLTRYEGFVRMGSRRGFHLLLVVETPEGFRPLLPKGA